eukprot:TRINITY_DN1529_c0_g1_i2.p1 TRINITY_DN1529_c0_g1~~TRINITY_DN1529_c0_g1_i2.p1  ORF type:complete len:456 (+),score=113.30 TRINITY_DN1529_c0_g1_i2:345-1712(+)
MTGVGVNKKMRKGLLVSLLLVSTILLLSCVHSVQSEAEITEEKDEAQEFIDNLISQPISESSSSSSSSSTGSSSESTTDLTVTEETTTTKEEAPFQTQKRMLDGIKDLEAKFRELKMKRQLLKQKKRDATEEGGSTAATASGSGGTSDVEVGEPWFRPIPVISATFGIVFGILFVGFGYRCYHLTTFGAGCIPTSGFFYLILTIHTSVYTGVALLIGLFVGVAFGVATLLFNPAAHAALGGFTGILIAAVFATTIETVVFDWLVVLIIPIVLAFCGVCLPKQITIFSTSLCGSYGIMAAIDYFGFGAAGFSNFFPKLLSNFENLNPNWMTWLLVFCTLALMTVGLMAQCCYTAREYEPQPIVDFRLHRASSAASLSSSSYEDVPDERDRDSSDSSPSTPIAHSRPNSTVTTAAAADAVSLRLATLANLPHPKPPPAPDVRSSVHADAPQTKLFQT